MATLTASRMGYPARMQEKGVFCEVSSITLAAAQIADIVNLCKVPAGATVIAVELVNAALGGGSTVSIGDGASATYYLNAQSTAAAARTASIALRKAYAADDTLKATIGGAAATGVLQVVVWMTMEATVLA